MSAHLSFTALRRSLVSRLAAAPYLLRLAGLALLLAAAATALVACATALVSGAMPPPLIGASPTASPVASATGSSSELAVAVPVAASPIVLQSSAALAGQPTALPSASATLAPHLPDATATPTAQSLAAPTLGAFDIVPLAGATVVTPHPTAMPLAQIGKSVVNILLVGTDYRASDTKFRTDTLIVASINTGTGAVSLLSIPRDLFVYIPKYGMARINQAYTAAESNGFPGGGPALLEQTILYNLGIPVHYYALVNFDGFRQIVDTLGGIDVAVNCQLSEYKLIDPTFDESDAANYELHTQPVGVARMDGALALWYARARPVGGDFFRGYRQRQVLRGIYQRGLRINVLPHIPALYADFREVVETDMTLWDIMQFAPLTAHVDSAQIRSLYIGPNQTTSWTTPAGDAVLLPRPEALQALVAEYFGQTSVNRLARDLTWVEVANAAPDTIEAALAAETLVNEGFAVRYAETPGEHITTTTIIDHSTSAKASPLKRLQSILHVADGDVVARPDTDSPVQFRVILGEDYNSCPRLDWQSH